MRLTRNKRFLIVWLFAAVLDVSVMALFLYKRWPIANSPGIMGYFEHPTLLLPFTFLPLAISFDIKPVMWFFNIHPYDTEDES